MVNSHAFRLEPARNVSRDCQAFARASWARSSASSRSPQSEREKARRNGFRLLNHLVIDAAQFASDRTLARPRGDRLFPIGLFFSHVQIPTLAACSCSVPESSVHSRCPRLLVLWAPLLVKA